MKIRAVSVVMGCPWARRVRIEMMRIPLKRMIVVGTRWFWYGRGSGVCYRMSDSDVSIDG